MLRDLLHFILIFFQVLVLFNLLIIVHEWGHFLAARWCGLVVEKFAIWFGKPIWHRKINGVDYALGFVPAGGYVMLPQMAPMESMEGKSQLKPEELPPVSPWKKIIVAFAGPLFSFLLALVFAIMVWFVGRPVSDMEATTTVGYVESGSEAERVGIQPGDRIVSIDDHPVTKFIGIGPSIMWRIIRSEGDEIAMTVDRNGKPLQFNLRPVYETRKFWQRRPLRQIPFAPAEKEVLIAATLPYSPARLAGLQKGDRILTLNGEALYSRMPIFHFIEQNPGKALTFTIQRKGSIFPVTIQPEVPEEPGDSKQPMIGLEFESSTSTIYPNPIEQIYSSVTAVFTTIDALLSPKSDVKASHMHGAIGIMSFYYSIFDSKDGWKQALWLSVLINVNLGLVNLLPIPVLDGGHIVLSILEAIRRKPLNIKIQEIIQMSFAGLIITYMLYVTFFDLQELPMPWKPPVKEIKFAPKNGVKNP